MECDQTLRQVVASWSLSSNNPPQEEFEKAEEVINTLTREMSLAEETINALTREKSLVEETNSILTLALL